MFYLGSLAGILPYVLVFSLTIIWGGQAGLPFFKPTSNASVAGEAIVAKGKLPARILRNYNFEYLIVQKKSTPSLIHLFIGDSTDRPHMNERVVSVESGIWLLRAPPVSLF